jgi:hypothetical protein
MNSDGNRIAASFVKRAGDPNMLARTAIFVAAHIAIIAATVAIGTAAQDSNTRIAVVEAGL